MVTTRYLQTFGPTRVVSRRAPTKTFVLEAASQPGSLGKSSPATVNEIGSAATSSRLLLLSTSRSWPRHRPAPGTDPSHLSRNEKRWGRAVADDGTRLTASGPRRRQASTIRSHASQIERDGGAPQHRAAALVRHGGGQIGGPVECVEPRISGDDAEPGRGSVSDRSGRHRFPTRRRGPIDYRQPRCVI